MCINHLKAICLFVFLPVLLTANTYNKGLRFHTNLSSAKKLAAREGKLYMVDFTAKWCTPCKWMDETTFSSENLASYMADSYIAVKVDIDDFDGFAYKQMYDIQMLPSILIFNSQGKLLKKYTGSKSTQELIEILKSHNLPQNRIKTYVAPAPTVENSIAQNESSIAVHPSTTPPAYSASRPTISRPYVSKPAQMSAAPSFSRPNLATNASNDISRPQLNSTYSNDAIIAEQTSVENSPLASTSYTAAPSYQEENTISTPSSTPTKPKYETRPQQYAYNEPTTLETSSYSAPVHVNTPVATAPEVITEEGLFEFTVRPYAKQGFSVQIGVFAEYGNVLREVNKLENRFNKTVLVNISKLKGRTVYKVLVGEFHSRESAAAFRNIVVADGTEGMVKNLAEL